MYYNINIERILANKNNQNKIVKENINVMPETECDIKEQWVNEIYDKYTPVSIFESSISDKLDKMIDNITSNPMNIKEYNKFVTKIRFDKIKLSGSNIRKILQFNTELILNPNVEIVDKKSIENIVNLPLILANEIVDTGDKASIAVYKKILDNHKFNIDMVKDADRKILDPYIQSIKDAKKALSVVKVKESFNTVGEILDDTISGTYLEKQFLFEYETVNLFLGEQDITIEQFQDYIRLAVSLGIAEEVMEAGKITNASRKVAKNIQTGIRRLDQKTSGKRETVGKNIKRIDNTLSGIVNKKVDQIINTGRDAKREKLITGRVSVKLGKLMKNTIRSLVATGAVNIVFGPIAATIAAITGLLSTYACSKRTEVREKKRILLELETEHKIVTEKIEDAKGENDKKQKYELMRIQANLEKEITRIKYNMRHY